MAGPIRATMWLWSRASTDSPRPRVLVAGAVVLLVPLALVTALVVAKWAPLIEFDRRFSADALALGHSSELVRSVAEVLALLGRDVGTILAVALAVILLGRRHRQLAVWLVASALGGFILHTTLKVLVGRARPDWPDVLATASSAAFPSGHAATGIDTWVVLGVILLAISARRRVRWVAYAVIAVGVLIGPSRLVLGVHWPSDVLAGWLLGAAWACLAAAGVLAFTRRRVS